MESSVDQILGSDKRPREKTMDFRPKWIYWTGERFTISWMIIRFYY